MRLTEYGKRTLGHMAAVVAAMVMLSGAVMVICNGAPWMFGGQKVFNLCYITMVMPVCFSVVMHIIYVTFDRKHGLRV